MNARAFFSFLKTTQVNVGDQWNTIPNWVTASCFPLAIGFVWAIFAKEYLLALGLLLLMTAGDFCDGALARILDQHSSLGKTLDWCRDWWYAVVIPLALFAFPGSFWWGFFVLYVAHVVIETVLLFFTYEERHSPSGGGKIHLLLKVPITLVLFSAYFLLGMLCRCREISVVENGFVLLGISIITLIVLCLFLFQKRKNPAL